MGPEGLTALVPVTTYLFAITVYTAILARGGASYLNLRGMPFAWNPIKSAVVGTLCPLTRLGH